MKKNVVCLCCVCCLIAPVAAVSPSSGEAEKPLLGFNLDFWYFFSIADSGCPVNDEWADWDKTSAFSPDHFGRFKADERGAEDFLSTVLRGPVTRLMINVNGQRAGYDSRVFEPYHAAEIPPGGGEGHLVKTARALREKGVDIYAVWIRQCRRKGVSPWLSVRMNDMHRAHLEGCPSISDFWRRHPELRRFPNHVPDNVWFWESQALDFAHAVVRNRLRDFIFEALGRYDVDGIELDWTRFPWILAPGREQADAPKVTALMREIRAHVRRVARTRGKPIEISCRFVSRPEVETALGRDVAVWAREGLMDEVSAGNHYRSVDYEIPVARWRALLGEKIRFSAYADNGLYFKHGMMTRRHLLREEYLGWADVMASYGCRDLNVFNLFCLSPRSSAWLETVRHGLGAQAVAGQPRRTVLSFRDFGLTRPEDPTYPARLPVALDRPFACTLPVGRVPARGRAEIILAFSDKAPARPAVSLNGCPALSAADTVEPDAPAAVRYTLSLSALRAGRNDISVSAAPERTLIYLALRTVPEAGGKLAGGGSAMPGIVIAKGETR